MKSGITCVRCLAASQVVFVLILLFKFRNYEDNGLVEYRSDKIVSKKDNHDSNLLNEGNSVMRLSKPNPIPVPFLSEEPAQAHEDIARPVEVETSLVTLAKEEEGVAVDPHGPPPPLRLKGTKFVLNNRQICKYGEDKRDGKSDSPRPVLLVLVQSRRDHFLQREAIRNTYGSMLSYKNWDIRVIFLIGKGRTVKNGTTHIRISWEFSRFGDAIMGPFIDSDTKFSAATTYQHVMGLRWAMEFCPRAKYIVKVNDDHFVNTLEIVDNTIPKMVENNAFFYCNISRGILTTQKKGDTLAGPNLDDTQQLPSVEYCLGDAYLADYDVMKRMYNLIPNTPFYKDEHDDLFITGRLRQALLFKELKDPLLLKLPMDDSSRPSQLKIMQDPHVDNGACFFVPKSFRNVPFYKLYFKSTLTKRFWCLWWNALQNKHMVQDNQQRKYIWSILAQ